MCVCVCVHVYAGMHNVVHGACMDATEQLVEVSSFFPPSIPGVDCESSGLHGHYLLRHLTCPDLTGV